MFGADPPLLPNLDCQSTTFSVVTLQRLLFFNNSRGTERPIAGIAGSPR
jgi:hypothetical protein